MIISQTGILNARPRAGTKTSKKRSNSAKIHTLEFYGALGGGNHTSDLEKKFYNDILFGSLFNPALSGISGFGLNTPWVNKTYTGGRLGVEYKRKRLLVNFESAQFVSRPSFNSFARVGNSDAELIYQRQTDLTLNRNRRTLLGGWLIYKVGDKHQLYILGGVNNIKVESVLEINGSGTLIGNPFLQNSFSHSNTTTGYGTGLAFGVKYRRQFSKKWGLSTRLLFSPALTGSWDYQQLLVNAPGGFDYKSETGNYKITSLSYNLKLDYSPRQKWRIFVMLYNEIAQHTDSEIILLDDAALVGNANFPAAFFLNYPGSSHRESIIGLNIGVSYKLDL